MRNSDISLLQRAKNNLFTAQTIISVGGDDGITDIAAYHCQQCVELSVKYMILEQGDSYANTHVTSDYCEDLNDPEIKALALAIAGRIDRWATSIRYSQTILTNKKMVQEVIVECEKIISLCEARSSKKESNPKPLERFNK